MLSEYGVISQDPHDPHPDDDGRERSPRMLDGTIEFTHTKRRPAELIQRTVTAQGRPLRIATRQAAIADLVRAGRNITMMDRGELADA